VCLLNDVVEEQALASRFLSRLERTGISGLKTHAIQLGKFGRVRYPSIESRGFGSRAYVASKRPQDSSSSGGLIHDWPQA
jgi:hypothetical protein